MAAKIEALTFDWYGTLANHRHKMGRGRLFSEYLSSHGLQSAPWDRSVLNKVFDYYGGSYKVEFCGEEKRAFWIQFTRLLFEQSQVSGATASQVRREHSKYQCFDVVSNAGMKAVPTEMLPELTARFAQSSLLDSASDVAFADVNR